MTNLKLFSKSKMPKGLAQHTVKMLRDVAKATDETEQWKKAVDDKSIEALFLHEADAYTNHPANFWRLARTLMMLYSLADFEAADFKVYCLMLADEIEEGIKK